MKRERKKQTENNREQQGKKFVKSKEFAQSKVSKKTKLLWLIILSLVTLGSYYPSLDNKITSWDDEFYLNTNPYLKDLSFENIKTLFDTDTYYMGNYHPLSMISLSVDYAIGGEDAKGNINPFMYHFTNILLHLLISLSIFWFVYLLLKKFNIAVLAALLFGVHTLHVESVAWISERKDVLYSLFFVLSLVAYVKYIDLQKTKYYILSLLLFLLSLFSKGQAVSLAVTLILIDYLRGRKLLNKKLILEKLPYFIFALIFGLIAIGAQKQSEALVDEQGYDFMQRIAIASYAFMMYVKELILPVNLSAINPYPDIIHQTVPALYYLMIIPASAIVFLFFWLIKKQKKTAAFAIGFFIVNIFLLLQFIPVGSAIHSDRYAYIPSIGYVILIAFFLFKIIDRSPKNKQIVYGLSGVYLVILSILTFMRCDVWQNSETLWKDTVRKSPTSVVAQNNLGSWKDRQAAKAMKEMNFEDAKKYRLAAISDFSKAIKGKPDYKNAFYNRGVSEFELGKLIKDTSYIQASVYDFNKALEQDAQFSDAYHNRGNAKADLGDLQGALKDFDLAISFNPEDAKYYVNRGVTKGKNGNIKGAIADFNKALSLDSDEKAAIYSNLGKAKMLQGKTDEAIKNYDYSIQLNPKQYTAYLNRALAKQKLGDLQGALKDFDECLKINPKMADAYYNRALLYLDMNKRKNACNDLERASNLGIQFAKILMQQYCK